jgi:hypothetical protein
LAKIREAHGKVKWRKTAFFLEFSIQDSAVTRKTRFLVLLLAIAFALSFASVLMLARQSRTIPISAIDQMEAAMLRDGFKTEDNTMFVDELALGPATPAKRWILGAVYPGYQNRGAHRVYIRDGARLGLDFGMRGTNLALNMSISADPQNNARARKIVRELSALNPNLAISLQTNPPATSSSR